MNSNPKAPMPVPNLIPTGDPMAPLDVQRITSSLSKKGFSPAESPAQRIAKLEALKIVPSVSHRQAETQLSPSSVDRGGSLNSDSNFAAPKPTKVGRTTRKRKSVTPAKLSFAIVVGSISLLGCAYFLVTMSNSKPHSSPNQSVAQSRPETPDRKADRKAEEPSKNSSPNKPVVSSGLAESFAGKFDLDVAPRHTTSDDSAMIAPGQVQLSPSKNNNEINATLQPILDEALRALALDDFDTFSQQMNQAHAMAGDTMLKNSMLQLDQVGQLYQIFVQAIDESIKKLKAGESFQVMNSEVGFVEGNDRQLIVRVSGVNQRYPRAELPPGIALGLADLSLSKDAPTDVASRGVYLMMNPKSNALTRKQGKQILEKVMGTGSIRTDLLEYLEQNFRK